MGKALEKLLNEQKFLSVMQALRIHLLVTKEGVTEGSPLDFFWNILSLVTTALTAELQAKENLQDRENFQPPPIPLEKKNQFPWIPSTYLDPQMHFEVVKPVSRLLDDLN